MRRWIDRLLDWVCSRFDLCIRFDGDLLTPRSPDDPWWYDEVRR